MWTLLTRECKGAHRHGYGDKEQDRKIGGQDISAHWKVTSSAFLGGQVQGDRQYGSVGEKT